METMCVEKNPATQDQDNTGRGKDWSRDVATLDSNQSPKRALVQFKKYTGHPPAMFLQLRFAHTAARMCARADDSIAMAIQLEQIDEATQFIANCNDFSGPGHSSDSFRLADNSLRIRSIRYTLLRRI